MYYVNYGVSPRIGLPKFYCSLDVWIWVVNFFAFLFPYI